MGGCQPWVSRYPVQMNPRPAILSAMEPYPQYGRRNRLRMSRRFFRTGKIIRLISLGAVTSFLSGCPTLGGADISGSLEGFQANRRYSASVRTSSGNTLGRDIENLKFEIEKDRVRISFRQKLPKRVQIAISEDDTIRCILVSDLQDGSKPCLVNGMTGEKFPIALRSGILVGEGIVFNLDRREEYRLDYNLASVRHSISIDTSEGVVQGEVGDMPPKAKLFIYPLGKYGWEEQPREVEGRHFRIQLDSGVHAAFGKIISSSGWDFDFGIPESIH